MTHYTYDELGQLKRVELPDGRVIDYLIDGENKRIAKYINGSLFRGYVYDHLGRLTGELENRGQVIALYVYGSESHSPDFMLRSTGTLIFVKDQLGSIRMVVGAGTGSMPQSIKYDEFGRVLQNTSPNFQPFGFAGGMYDPDTGLVRFGARDYDAEIGRWTSKDPILFNGGQINLYGYTFNDPINYIDTEGETAAEITGGGGGDLGMINQLGALGSGMAIGACMAEHTKNKRPSNKEKHEEGQTRQRRDQGGEKGDDVRRPGRQRPPGTKGPWPPK